MAYYLSEFVGDGSELNEFRPPVASQFGVIDLRGDTTVAAGRCLLWAPVDLPADPRYEKVADATVESIPRNIARRIENVLGVSLTQFDTLQAIIAELLILHGSFTDPGRWKPLRANRFGRHVIHLGGKIYDAPAPVGATFTDDFNRANENLTASANWAGDPSNQWQVVSNQLQGTITNTGDSETSFQSALDTDDHYVQMVHEDAEEFQLAARSARASDLEDMYLVTSQSGQMELLKRITGSFTLLVSETASRPAAPVTLRLEVDGSRVEGFWGGVSTASVTDTDITTGKFTGIRAQASTSPLADNYEIGDLGAAFDPANLQASVLADDVTLTHDSSF